MIYKVYPTLNDFENLSRLKIQSSDFANSFDYKDVVVNKPWGYEYLWFQNDSVAIWFLYIKKNNETSLHCHARKRTSLIVLNGEVQCTTLDDRYIMNTLESVVLEPCVFHSSKAVSDEGAFIMEIETPPMKGDLIRMNDAYGRQNTGYESTTEYSKEFGKYEFLPFIESCYSSWKFKNIEIKLSTNTIVLENSTEMIVPISGNVKALEKVVIECGEAINCNTNTPFDDIVAPEYKFLIFNSIKND